MSGRSPATVSSKRASYASRVSPALRCHGITCTRETPADRARSIAYARGLLHTTEATSSGSAPAAQPSSPACKFEPLPDAITTARARRSRNGAAENVAPARAPACSA